MRLEQLEGTVQDVDRQQLLERENGLCQSLAGIAALSSTLSRSLAASEQWGLAAMADEIFRLFNETTREAHDLVHSLSPNGPHNASLPDSPETLARNAGRMYAVSRTFRWDCRFSKLSIDTEIHLVRVAREALSNAVAHG